MLILFPILPALLAGRLYVGGRHVIAADAKIQPWYELGRRLLIGGCAGALLIQGMQILESLGVQIPVSVGLSINIVIFVIVLQAINQQLKLPWIESRFHHDGELGPISGPRFMRAAARVWLVCSAAANACLFALPAQAPYVPLFILFSLVWTLASLRHYRRRWKLEQAAASGVNS